MGVTFADSARQLVSLSFVYLCIFIIACVALGGTDWVRFTARDPTAPIETIYYGLRQYITSDRNGTISTFTYSDCMTVSPYTPVSYTAIEPDGSVADVHCPTMQHAANVALGFGVFAVLILWTIIGVLFAMAMRKVERMELARLVVMFLTLLAEVSFLFGTLVYAAQAETVSILEQFGASYALYVVCTILLFGVIGLLILLDGSTDADEAAVRAHRQRALVRDAVPVAAPTGVNGQVGGVLGGGAIVGGLSAATYTRPTSVAAVTTKPAQITEWDGR